MGRIREGMPPREAVDAIMKRVPSARGGIKNLSARDRAKKALDSLSGEQLCCIIDALWVSLSRHNSELLMPPLRGMTSAYNAAVSFIAMKVVEKEEAPANAAS